MIILSFRGGIRSLLAFYTQPVPHFNSLIAQNDRSLIAMTFLIAKIKLKQNFCGANLTIVFLPQAKGQKCKKF